jgi:hypothetical protein
VGLSPSYLCDIEKNKKNCTDRVRQAYESLAM